MLECLDNLSFEFVNSILAYDQATGNFKWRISKSGIKTPLAGCIDSQGYWVIRIEGISYYGHRLAWLLYYGKWPKGKLDHRNGNKKDNRIKNLREATVSQNGGNRKINRNNSCGYKGVIWHKRNKRWLAKIQYKNKVIYLGYFKIIEDAASCYDIASQFLFGEFSYINNPTNDEAHRARVLEKYPNLMKKLRGFKENISV